MMMITSTSMTGTCHDRATPLHLRLRAGFALLHLFCGRAHAGQVPDPSTLSDRAICLTAYYVREYGKQLPANVADMSRRFPSFS
jgi:hypothetical protein